MSVILLSMCNIATIFIIKIVIIFNMISIFDIILALEIVILKLFFVVVHFLYDFLLFLLSSHFLLDEVAIILQKMWCQIVNILRIVQ